MVSRYAAFAIENEGKIRPFGFARPKDIVLRCRFIKLRGVGANINVMTHLGSPVSSPICGMTMPRIQKAQRSFGVDAVWFFPAFGSLVPQPNVVLTYVGSESRHEQLVQHIQAHLYQPSPYPGKGPSPEQLSTMDFYLDASTLLPVAVTFNAHPDSDASTNLSVEIDYFNYQLLGGVSVPTHVQKYLQGSPIFDIELSGAVFNTGLSLATFTIN